MTEKEHKKMMKDLDKIFIKTPIRKIEKDNVVWGILIITVYQIQNKEGSIINFLKKEPKSIINESILDYKEPIVSKYYKDEYFSLIKYMFRKYSITSEEHNKIFEIVGVYCFFLIIRRPEELFKLLQEWEMKKQEIK